LILETVYVRHFRSFNFDFLRQDLTDQEKYPWDELTGLEDYESEEDVDEDEDDQDEVDEEDQDEEDQDQEDATVDADDAGTATPDVTPGDQAEEPGLDSTTEEVVGDSYYPFVTVQLERDITTVVGANETGKSQLITAIQCLLGDHEIRPRDFCRYSKFFGVRRSMRLPEFGGRFTAVTAEERYELIATVGRNVPGDFWFFRLQRGPVLYFEEDDGSITSVDLTGDQAATLPLPTARRIDSKVVLPSSASLFDLASGEASPQPRSRDQWLDLFKQLKEFSDDPAKASSSTIADWLPKIGARQLVDVEKDAASLNLVRALLESVAEVDSRAYTELLKADAEDDGYTSALTTSVTEALGVSLNFQKWWSQDRDFSLQVHKDAFHLVFTLKDKTGQTYTFDERSGGMQYFLSYFIQREAYSPKNPRRSEILLMDEPDAYLSTMGQQDLMRVFARYAFPDDGKPAAQVMYVTHSPFLIDKNYPHRSRVLQKGLGEEGTRVVQKAATEKYEPLRSAFSSFHADTAFIGTCNLLVEGPADLILFSGISAGMKREPVTRPTLDLNALTMVPVHGAGNYRYLVHLTRGRDLDRPAIVVLLDSDRAGDRANADLNKLENGFGDKPIFDKDMIYAIDQLPIADMTVDVSEIHEPEDLVPATVARRALAHFVSEFRSPESQQKILDELADPLVIDPKLRLFDQARDALLEASTTAGAPLTVGKIEFAHAVSAVVRAAESSEGLEGLYTNFGALFAELNSLQEAAMERHTRERITEITKRIVERFKRDHKTRASKHTVARLLDEIESHLEGGAGREEEAVRLACRSIREEFALEDSPMSNVENFSELRKRLKELVLAPQRSTM
jgi:predicted ATPase